MKVSERTLAHVRQTRRELESAMERVDLAALPERTDRLRALDLGHALVAARRAAASISQASQSAVMDNDDDEETNG